MLFIVAAVLAAGFAIYQALTTEDVVNDFIDDNLPNLIRTEAILFSVILAGFVYCATKLLFKLKEKKYDYLVFLVVFSAIIGNFIVSFDRDVGSFGDNASYIINTKSLLEMGAPHKLNHPEQPFDSKAALGLPIMLSPIVGIWGMDVLKMKVLVFILGCLSILFFFMAFRRRLGIYGAALIAILIGTYPLIVYNTSYVMTEVPFLFCLSLTLYVTYLFQDASTTRRSIITGLAVIALSMLCYLTRAVGIGVIAGTLIWLFLWIPWMKIIREKINPLALTEVRKFLLVTAGLAICVMGWQLRSTGSTTTVNAEGSEEVVKNKSHARTFMAQDMNENLNRNFNLIKPVLGQQIFNKKLSRWYLSLGKDDRIKPLDGSLKTYNFFLFAALIIGLIRRRLPAYWLLIVALVTLAGSQSKVSVVFSRYLIVVVPFMIYIWLDLLINGGKWLADRLKFRAVEYVGTLGALVFSYLMLSHSLSGAAYNNQRQNAGDTYTLAFDNFIRAAQWVEENIEDDVVIASRKPRLFYVYSEKRGMMTVSYGDMTYSEEAEQKIIDNMRRWDAKYLIMDAFSTASRKVVLPTIQNNGDIFRVVKAVGEKYPAYVIEFSG